MLLDSIDGQLETRDWMIKDIKRMRVKKEVEPTSCSKIKQFQLVKRRVPCSLPFPELTSGPGG